MVEGEGAASLAEAEVRLPLTGRLEQTLGSVDVHGAVGTHDRARALSRGKAEGNGDAVAPVRGTPPQGTADRLVIRKIRWTPDSQRPRRDRSSSFTIREVADGRCRRDIGIAADAHDRYRNQGAGHTCGAPERGVLCGVEHVELVTAGPVCPRDAISLVAGQGRRLTIGRLGRLAAQTTLPTVVDRPVRRHPRNPVPHRRAVSTRFVRLAVLLFRGGRQGRRFPHHSCTRGGLILVELVRLVRRIRPGNESWRLGSNTFQA